MEGSPTQTLLKKQKNNHQNSFHHSGFTETLSEVVQWIIFKSYASSFHHLSRFGSWGQQLEEGSPYFPIPNHFIQLSFFSLTAFLTAGVYPWVQVLPPQQAPTTLRPQYRLAASTMDAQNMAHLSPASPRTFKPPSDGGLNQAFLANPQNKFGSAGSYRHPPPPP